MFLLSIQKGFSSPPVQKCNACCFPPKFHCPFCLPVYFKPTKLSRLMEHLGNHHNRAIFIGDKTIHKCGLECRRQPHYHCLYCPATLMRKRDCIRHLLFCRRAQQRRALKLSNRQEQRVTTSRMTPGDSHTPYDIVKESDDDSNVITIIPDSPDQHSQGARSSQSKTSVMSKSNDCHSVEPNSSKCHQTVRPNVEKPQDCDEYYFMSLVKTFKKLSPQKKAEVRMKIERLLFEAEFN